MQVLYLEMHVNSRFILNSAKTCAYLINPNQSDVFNRISHTRTPSRIRVRPFQHCSSIPAVAPQECTLPVMLQPSQIQCSVHNMNSLIYIRVHVQYWLFSEPHSASKETLYSTVAYMYVGLLYMVTPQPNNFIGPLIHHANFEFLSIGSIYFM